MAGDNARERTALIITVLNEAPSIDALMSSIADQTRPPDEVVVVDGGSSDDTLRRLETWQGRVPLKVLEAPGATIARGRNLGIEATECDLIAVTDAGVRLDSRWLETLLNHLSPEVHVVAGFFSADPRTTFEKVMGATVLPAVEDVAPTSFLPSSRSVLFRRSAWQAIGGYPGWLDYCEDLVFDLALRAAHQTFAFAPDAIAWFRPRGSLTAFFRQYYRYARGDGKADLWPRRHLVRYATYAAAPLLLTRGWRGLWLLLLGAALYTRRPYQRLGSALPGLSRVQIMYAVMLVPVIRLVGDMAKMLGYPAGVTWRLRQWISRSSS